MNPKGFTLLELMVIVAIIGLLAAIAIPNYIGHRNKAYCSQAEKDAYAASRAISDYFSVPSRANLPTAEDLSITTNNPYHITGDPNITIVVHVKDRTNRCPDAYQRASEHWEAVTNYFSIPIE